MGEKQKPLWRKVLGLFSLVFMGLSLITSVICAPVSFATGGEASGECPDGSVETSILGNGGCATDDGNGSGIIDLITFIVNVLSVGVAIFAAIGIILFGTQYLTAGGDEGKVKTAKRRLIEVVIGLVVYVVIYSMLVWLLPGFGN